MSSDSYDAIVVGGGFFGCELATYLKTRKGFQSVLVLEQESRALNRASRWNQARVHGGYHYPRDFVTAHRSRMSQPLFVEHYSSAIYRNVTSVYAIARRGSHVTAETFLRRMKQAEAPISRAPDPIWGLFSPALVEAVFEVEEKVFDADALRRAVEKKLIESGVESKFGARVVGVEGDSNQLRVLVRADEESIGTFEAKYVFNCTYSGLNTIDGSGSVVSAQLKHEIAELTLIDVPDDLKELAITVVDGPFFSVLPYPPEKTHSLSHVRYTPTFSWRDGAESRNPYEVLGEERHDSRSDRMLRDAARFVPALKASRVVGKFREVKTVLLDTEDNDGRPILIEQSEKNRRLYSILGGKIDNVFDMFKFFDRVHFDIEGQ